MTIRPSRIFSVAAAMLLLGACIPSAETPADASAGELSARVKQDNVRNMFHAWLLDIADSNGKQGSDSPVRNSTLKLVGKLAPAGRRDRK